MKISILLPNYNHGALIAQCVRAVMDQTYRDWELIIIDDGSSDDSPAIIQSLAAADARITPLLVAENMGALAALHTGFACATGELFFGVASDDFLVDPEFFASAVAELAERPTAAGVFARCRVVDQADLHELWTMGSAPKNGFNTAADCLQAFFDNKIFVPGGSAIWRLDLVRAAGFFDATLGPQCDYYLNHALPAMADGVIFLDRVVAAVRASSGSYSRSAADEDFLRRHALVEKKLRALPVASALDPALIQHWRFAIINARLSITWQRRLLGLFDQVKQAASGIQPYERDNIPPDLLSMIETCATQCASLEAELVRRVATAEAIFEEVAGPLGNTQQ